MKSVEDAKASIFKGSKEPAGEPIKGYDFSKGLDMKALLDGYASSGAQASELGKAISLVKSMRKDKVMIILGYTSNMVSTGVREAIRFLVKNRLVDVLVTTAGGIEEDFIKTHKPFLKGDFRADGAELRKIGMNRIGNIFAPNERYIWFEKFFQPLVKELAGEQKAGKMHSPSEIIWRMGKAIASEDSIYYWAWKNQIPVFCPAFMDGAIGDNFFFYSYQDNVQVDIVADQRKLIDLVLGAKDTGIIILGGGVMKHTICNANMFREGAKYAVYINTAPEYDASDSGALPEEAKSWGKIAAGAGTVKVFADATIAFPLLVAGAFVD